MLPVFTKTQTHRKKKRIQKKLDKPKTFFYSSAGEFSGKDSIRKVQQPVWA